MIVFLVNSSDTVILLLASSVPLIKYIHRIYFVSGPQVRAEDTKVGTPPKRRGIYNQHFLDIDHSVTHTNRNKKLLP